MSLYTTTGATAGVGSKDQRVQMFTSVSLPRSKQNNRGNLIVIRIPKTENRIVQILCLEKSRLSDLQSKTSHAEVIRE